MSAWYHSSSLYFDLKWIQLFMCTKMHHTYTDHTHHSCTNILHTYWLSEHACSFVSKHTFSGVCLVLHIWPPFNHRPLQLIINALWKPTTALRKGLFQGNFNFPLFSPPLPLFLRHPLVLQNHQKPWRARDTTCQHDLFPAYFLLNIEEKLVCFIFYMLLSK